MEAQPTLHYTCGYGHFEGLVRHLSGDVQRHRICEMGVQERGQDKMYKLGNMSTWMIQILSLDGIILELKKYFLNTE